MPVGWSSITRTTLQSATKKNRVITFIHSKIYHSCAYLQALFIIKAIDVTFE